ncbi:hypothetical protein BDY24DRAFT_195152 [Mrakia frigida]|uniref:uncharacterized protein n=1 Tax=Mrakia frigida TaxID=29902 RepID=UPI003FCC2192
MSARRPKPKDVPDVEQAAYDTLQERVVLLTGNAFLFARGDDSLPKKSFEDAVLGRLELDEDLSKHDSTKLLHHARNHEKRHRHEMWEACKEPASQWLQSVEGQTYFETIKSGTAYIDSKLQKPRFPTVNQSLESDWISYELVETAFKDPLLCTTESARSRSSEFFSRLRRATAYAFKFEVWRIARFFSTVPGGIVSFSERAACRVVVVSTDAHFLLPLVLCSRPLGDSTSNSWKITKETSSPATSPLRIQNALPSSSTRTRANRPGFLSPPPNPLEVEVTMVPCRSKTPRTNFPLSPSVPLNRSPESKTKGKTRPSALSTLLNSPFLNLRHRFDPSTTSRTSTVLQMLTRRRSRILFTSSRNSRKTARGSRRRNRSSSPSRHRSSACSRRSTLRTGRGPVSPIPSWTSTASWRTLTSTFERRSRIPTSPSPSKNLPSVPSGKQLYRSSTRRTRRIGRKSRHPTSFPTYRPRGLRVSRLPLSRRRRRSRRLEGRRRGRWLAGMGLMKRRWKRRRRSS